MSVILHREKNRYGAMLTADYVSDEMRDYAKIISINQEVSPEGHGGWFNIWIEIDSELDRHVIQNMILWHREPKEQ